MTEKELGYDQVKELIKKYDLQEKYDITYEINDNVMLK